MEELRINSPYCQAIVDLLDNFDINSIPDEDLEWMYRSYTDSYMTSLEFIEPDDNIKDIVKDSKKSILKEQKENGVRIYPVSEVVERLTSSLPMKKKQFITVSNNGIENLEIDMIPDFWVQPIAVSVPNVYMNLGIVDERMMGYGYVRVRKTKKVDKNGKVWWFVIYNPDPRGAENIRDIIEDFCRFLHLTPNFNTASILKNGLRTSKGGRVYTYPDERVFFYAPSFKNPFNYTNEFRTMMRSISRHTKKEHPEWDGYFDVIELMIREIPEDIKVFWDPNRTDCVYLNIPIEPKYLKLRKERSVKF